MKTLATLFGLLCVAMMAFADPVTTAQRLATIESGMRSWKEATFEDILKLEVKTVPYPTTFILKKARALAKLSWSRACGAWI